MKVALGSRIKKKSRSIKNPIPTPYNPIVAIAVVIVVVLYPLRGSDDELTNLFEMTKQNVFTSQALTHKFVHICSEHSEGVSLLLSFAVCPTRHTVKTSSMHRASYPQSGWPSQHGWQRGRSGAIDPGITVCCCLIYSQLIVCIVPNIPP